MCEISNKTGVSKSTVQRILNQDNSSRMYIPSTGRTVKEQLQYNLVMGKRKGGKHCFQNNIALKDNEGKFIGCIENNYYVDKEEEKQQDVNLIVEYYCSHSTETLDNIVEQINEKYNKRFTKSYVYDCLLDSRVELLFGPIVSQEIKLQLSNNNQGFFKKFGFISMDIETLSKYQLTDKEIAVLLYRFNNGTIKSTQDAALHFNCSKTVITNIDEECKVR